MQRLFISFPSGLTGIALAALRIAVAGMVIMDLIPSPGLGLSLWQMMGAVLLFLFITMGTLTPLLCALCCLIEIANGFRAGVTSGMHLGIMILITAAWGVLGPGAYSLDAFLFGRKRIVLTNRRFEKSEE